MSGTKQHKNPVSNPVLRHRILLACLFLIMLFIFGQSAKPADVSSLQSGRILRVVQAVIHQFDLPFSVTAHFIRKTAHVLEYAGLGLCLMLNRRAWPGKQPPMSLALLVGLVIPVIDEWLQLHVPGRSGQVHDILLDFCGVLLGMALGVLLEWATQQLRKRKV